MIAYAVPSLSTLQPCWPSWYNLDFFFICGLDKDVSYFTCEGICEYYRVCWRFIWFQWYIFPDGLLDFFETLLVLFCPLAHNVFSSQFADWSVPQTQLRHHVLKVEMSLSRDWTLFFYPGVCSWHSATILFLSGLILLFHMGCLLDQALWT